jgi:para-nitrobenzyl esterase
MAQSSMAFAAAALPCTRALADTAKQESVEVNTAYGRVRGVKTGDLTTFKGVPYGGPVSGANRFKASPPLTPWAGVRDALQLGAPSLQPGGQRRNEPPSDENCLFLNVWTPAADGRKRPVMFYSHG